MFFVRIEFYWIIDFFTGTLIQKKWKNLRDCYSREKGKQNKEFKSGAAAIYRKKYVYFENLKFLQSTMKSSQTGGSMDDDEEEGSKEDGQEEQEQTEVNQRKQNSRKKKKSNEEDDELIKCLKTRILQKQEADENDEDRHFLLSLVPDIKKIPPHMKFDFKMRIMTVVSQTLQAIPSTPNQPPNNAYYPYPQSHMGGSGVAYAKEGHGHFQHPNQPSTSYGYPPQQGVYHRPENQLQGYNLPPLHVNAPVTVAPMYQAQHREPNSTGPTEAFSASSPSERGSESSPLAEFDF